MLRHCLTRCNGDTLLNRVALNDIDAVIHENDAHSPIGRAQSNKSPRNMKMSSDGLYLAVDMKEHVDIYNIGYNCSKNTIYLAVDGDGTLL